MCDQTEVIYSPGDVVWVKLGPVWWPGQVYDYDKLPEEITANLRKKPLAVVKFFQEDSYEYVKNLNSIYHYNCRKKHEFIKKGLDMCRSNNRDVPSNMKMFPNDVVTAEHLTNGNPNILNSKEFAPEEKEDYSELFGKKTPKKGKTDSGKKDISWRLKGVTESSLKAGRRSLPTPTIPRPITHPRFITKALEGRSDHEVRIRQQVLPSGSRNSSGTSKQYNCHLCGFSSSRINVIVLHNKSHSDGYAEAYLPPPQQASKSRKTKPERKMVYSSEKRQRVSDVSRLDEPPVKRRNAKQDDELYIPSRQFAADKSGKITDSPLKKPVFGRKKSAKDKAEKLAKEKQQNDAFRETLLKDWDEDEDNEEDKVDTSTEEVNKEKEEDFNLELSSCDKGESNSKRKEISCFDFDDSEDGLNIGETVMKFGQKIPRVLGEKPKKQTKSLLEEEILNVDSASGSKLDGSCDEFNQMALDETSEKTESKEKETEELHSVFKSLLDQTVVPVIPDAPTHLDMKKKSIGFDSSLHHQIHDDGNGSDDVEGGDGHDQSVDNIVSLDTGGILVNEGSVEVDKESVVEKEDLNKPNSESISTNSSSSSNIKVVDEENISDEVESKEMSCENTEHFLVKTSEEVATSSSDDAQVEESISPDENNVAKSKIVTNSSNSLKSAEDFSLTNRNSLDSTEINSEKQEEFEATKIIPKTSETDSNVFITSGVRDESEAILPSVIKGTEEVKTDLVKNSFSISSGFSGEDVTGQHLSATTIAQNQPSNETERNNFQEMDFDINSMPVIISEDMIQHENSIVSSSTNKSESFLTKVTPVKTDTSSAGDSKLVMVKNVTKQAQIGVAASSNLSAILKEEINTISHTIPLGKDIKTPTRKVLISPTKNVSARPSQVATIKVQPSSSVSTKLTVPGGIISQKSAGSTSQVLILKSAGPGQSGKSALQKISTTSQMIQQGGKVLILTNPQNTSGQSKVLTSLSAQQKGLSPSKLTGTRILTTKGTVLTTIPQGTISKANILSGSSKTVTTKSGQKILINKGGVISQTPKSVIINKSGVLTSVNSPAIVSNKPTVMTQNILSSKTDLAASSQINPSQITVSSKATTGTILAPGFTTKNMILAPVSNNKGLSLASNQKLRLITSKASPGTATSTSSGAKLMIQSSQSRMILPSSVAKSQQLKLVGNLKGQSSTSTILIQTSQGVIATTPLTSNQLGNKAKITKSSLPTAVMSTTLPSNKTTAIQVAQTLPQTQNKLIVQKVKPAGPNILQKTQKKPLQRNNKRTVSNQLITTVTAAQNIQTARSSVTVSPLASTAAQDALILSPASGIPVMGQSNVVQGNQLDPSNQTALVYLTLDESGNYRPLESTPIVNYEGTTSDSQTLYIDPGTGDLDNIFLAIDDAGNVVNITQPVQNTFTTESSTPPPSQDILAKALANTQVLQQETIATESLPLTSSVESSVLGGCMFVEPQNQYPQPSLSHSVLETSLTLNQPIMTPLEVPSSVSPRSLDQISSLQSGFLSESALLTTNACAGKEKKVNVHPSMPLLTEESDCSAAGDVNNKNETVYFTQVGVDGSHAVLTPVTSGSHLAFQLALDENNVIVSSTSGMSSLGVITSSSLPQSSLTYIPQSELSTESNTSEKNPLINLNNPSTTNAVFTGASQEINVVENYELDEKPLENEQVTMSDNNTLKNISNENLVLDMQQRPITESFEIKDGFSEQKDDKDATSCVVNKVNVMDDLKSVTRDDETYMIPVSASTNDASLSTSSELTESKVTGSYSNDPDPAIINDQSALNLNKPIHSSVDDESMVTKTDVVAAVKEETLCATTTNALTETAIINGNGDIQTSKRHLEGFNSPPDNLSTDIEVKKIKLDER